MAIAVRTLLVIDDVEDNCVLLKHRLEKKGYKVEIALDGQEGFLVLARKAIDLILLDLDMPVMNGFTFLEKLLTEQKHAHIPVIITSSLDDPDTKSDCMTYGARGFVAKPCDMKKLFSMINDCLATDTA